MTTRKEYYIKGSSNGRLVHEREMDGYEQVNDRLICHVFRPAPAGTDEWIVDMLTELQQDMIEEAQASSPPSPGQLHEHQVAVNPGHSYFAAFTHSHSRGDHSHGHATRYAGTIDD